jgi:ribosomal protein S18 acetylase RimI-like enzyme
MLTRIMPSSLIIPSAPITTRLATMDDLAFMDALQKKTTRQVGYFPTAQFKGYIEMGAVVIAEGTIGTAGRTRVGYCISRDRYLKRDELGIIYQLNVVPEARRMNVGASLIREVLARAAYGCRLFCCWCAQDIEANRFWESLGFVPVAFRAGSAKKKVGKGASKRSGRVHIFWQRRVHADDSATPYWYPFQTNQGAIRQDRLVFPIPPGTHWTEVEAMAVPMTGGASSDGADPSSNGDEPAPARRPRKAKAKPAKPDPASTRMALFVGGKLRYVDRPVNAPPVNRPAPTAAPTTASTTTALATMAEATATAADARQTLPAKKPPTPQKRIDPAFLAQARELRDRYLEQYNAGTYALPIGKYEVGRPLPETSPETARDRAIAGGGRGGGAGRGHRPTLTIEPTTESRPITRAALPAA